MSKVSYTVKKEGDGFVLYFIVKTNFGGDAKNFVRESATLSTVN